MKERQEANAKASHAEGRAATTQEEAINNALAASDEALVSHRAAYKAALEAGDSEKAVEAQEKFTEAKYLNSELKKQKVVVERWKKDQEELAKRPKETQLPPSVQAWIARNPKYNSDTDYRDEADAAHDVAIRKGYGFGSPAYIEFIDKRLEKMFPVEKLLSENDTKPEKPISYSAPPNRGSSTEGGSQSERKFKLTAAEVEAAVITGYAEDEHDKKGLLAYAMAKEEGKS